MTRKPKNVVAVTPGGQITMDMILGFIALCQVPNEPMSAAKLRRLWLAEGLEESLIPKQRKPVNAFQMACRSVETRRVEHGSLKAHEVKVDEVMETTDECVYQITQLVRDKDNKLIEHPKAMRLTFDKKDGTIKDEPLDKKTYKALKALAQDVQDDFERNSSKIPGSKLRRAIRATLKDQHSTMIQNKGVFFVPKAGKGSLDSIQNVLTGLYGDDGKAELYLVPCANDEGERAMIARHFQANVGDQIDKLLAEISARLKAGGQVRSDRQKSLIADRRRLGAGVEKYRDMLDDKLLLVGEKMRLLDDGLEQLLIAAD